MQAIITAGGTLKANSPLFKRMGIAKKALLPIKGKAMITWIAEALIGSKYIDSLIVVGLKAGDFDDSNLPITYIDDQGGMVSNILVGLDKAREIDGKPRALVCSSDIPLITSEIVDEFIEHCPDETVEFYYSVVEKQIMEKRFPGSKRTFTKMKGGDYTGGDISMLTTDYSQANLELFRSGVGKRKNPFAQAQVIGFSFIFRFIFRRMDIYEGVERASKVLNVKGAILDYHRAEIGMDVDKLEQYLLVKKELEAN